MEKRIKPAIVVIGYNRPESMARLLNSIKDANYNDSEITLIISIDKSDKYEDVMKVAEDFSWQNGRKIIRKFDTRQGLKNHVLQCGDFSIEYEAVIMLEDDLVVSPSFYNYTQEALEFYKDDNRIVGVSLYSHQWNGFANRFFSPSPSGPDIYCAQFSVSWGQCWSKKQWLLFKDWYKLNEGKLELKDSIPSRITNWPETSWGKYFAHFLVESNKFYIMPYEALSTNFTEIGEHSSQYDNTYQVPLLMGTKNFTFTKFENSIKYDIFFERMEIERYFEKEISEKGICVDLYGTKRGYGNNQYLLSTERKPYKVKRSYGLIMRPQETNIIFNINGNDIFLYDTSQALKNNLKRKKINSTNIKYDVRGYNWKPLLSYGLADFKRALKSLTKS